MTKPTFSIRGFLLFTATVAVSCFAWVTPSVQWLVVLPVVTCIWIIVAFCRAFDFFRRPESYWLLAFLGVTAYWIAFYCVNYLFTGDRMKERMIQFMRWNQIDFDLSASTFIVSHSIACIFTSLIAAYVVQLIWPPKE